MEQTTNTITLRGELAELPSFSHENHGKKFYRFELLVSRLSGTVDCLPVVAEDRLLNQLNLCGGDMLRVTGQIRSHNIRTDGIRRLLIFVYATELWSEYGESVNEVILEGSLCREPNYRHTPLGREICDVMLAVPRSFHRADYLPCILWGRTAQSAASCHVRDRLRICGRMQSRSYTKLTEVGPEERIAYEISALTAELRDALD